MKRVPGARPLWQQKERMDVDEVIRRDLPRQRPVERRRPGEPAWRARAKDSDVERLRASGQFVAADAARTRSGGREVAQTEVPSVSILLLLEGEPRVGSRYRMHLAYIGG